MVILRITAFIFLFFGAVFLPWPVVAGLAAIAMAGFSLFWESIIIGLALGVIYATKGNSFIFAFFISSFAGGLLVEEYCKKMIEGENIISRVIAAFSGGAVVALFWLVFKLALY